MTLSVINSKIEEAEKSSGRAIGSTQLLAVSKVQPNERVLNVLKQGHQYLVKIKFKKLKVNGQRFVKIFPDAESAPNWTTSNKQSKTSCRII